MMRFLAKGTIGLLCALLPCSNALSDIVNPYKNYKYWAKGQVHCHSNRSDGSRSCREVADAYSSKKYVFFFLTDHSDGHAGGAASNPMPLSKILDDCTFQDGKKEQYILYIPGIESDNRAGIIRAGRHFLGLNITQKKIHDGKNSQKQIDDTIKQGGIAVLAHPKDETSPWNVFDIFKYKNYHGLQFNGKGEDRVELTVKQWDAILYTGRKVWIFGGDDFHRLWDDDHYDKAYIVVNLNLIPQNANHLPYYKAWVNTYEKMEEIKADEKMLTQEIVRNIKSGNFYAVYCKEGGWDKHPDRAPRFERIKVSNGDTIQVKTSKPCKFTFVAGLRNPIEMAEKYYLETAKYYFPHSMNQIIGEYSPAELITKAEEIEARLKGVSYEKIAEAKTERFVLPKTGTSTSVTFPLFDYLKYPSLYRYVRIEAKDDYGNILYSQPIFIEGLMLPNVDKLDIYAEGKLLAKERIIVGQNLVIYGDLQTDSNNKSIVETDNFGLRKLYADESTEVMLFERGTAQLKDGEVTVHLDPMFLEMVAIDDNNPVLIKITLTSDCKGIYVSKKTASGFTIKEIEGGTSSATFNWEAAAKRRGYEEIRLKEPSAE